MISPEQSGDITKNYCGHKIELFLDNLGNQELDNSRDHKHAGYKSYWHVFLKDAFHHFYTVPVEQTAADYIQICSIQMFL